MWLFAVSVIVVVVPPTTVNGLDCPYLAMPVGANRSTDDAVEGTTVTYSCLNQQQVFDTGHLTLSMRCLSSGDWSRLPSPCKDARCGPQHIIHYSSVSTTSTRQSQRVIYRCLYGYGFPDGDATKLITCDTPTLEWKEAPGDVFANMTCNVRFCTSPPANLSTVFYDGLDAYDVNGSVPIGSIITAYCHEGYLRSSSTILKSGKCAASGNLDGDYQECRVQACANIPTPSNAIMIFSNTEYPRRRRYHCNVGLFPGGKNFHSMECDSNGQWKSEPSASGCQVGGCETGWIQYGDYCYFISSSDSWGLRYFYAEQSCTRKQAHLTSVNSREEALFLYSKTYQVSQRDHWIGYHYDVLQRKWRWFDGSNLTYSRWHRGYPELSISCARLTINSVWKDRNCDDLMPYICKKPTMCAAPPTILNGAPDIAVIPVAMDVGQSLTYTCLPGYSFRSDSTSQRTVTCMPGAFYSAIENCQRTMCRPLNRVGFFVRNAVIAGSQASTYMSDVTWTCNPGYIFPDGIFSKVITCLPNRTWSYVPEMCIKVRCPVPAILNAQPFSGSREVGQADIYKCDVGHEFSNGEQEKTMACQADGTWTPGDSCWKRDCQPYYQVSGNITGGVKGIAKYRDKVEITCVVGYEFPDGTSTKSTACGPNYHWLAYLPPCRPKVCPGGVAPIVPNAVANTSSAIIGTVVLYTCNASYFFIDGDTKRVGYCDIDTQQWVNVPTECIDHDAQTQDNDIGIPTVISSAIAVVAITLIIIFVWLIVCSECNEDRKVIAVCNNYQRDGAEEQDEDSERDTPSPEPIRFQMAA